MKGILRISDLTAADIACILRLSKSYQSGGRTRRCLNRKIVGTFFFQESTRTRLGFQGAAVRLGGGVVGLHELRYGPVMEQAESLSDTLRSVGSYCDIAVVRHPHSEEFYKAAALSPVPVINGGAGTEEHPTQALIDLYSILVRRGGLSNLRIGFIGRLNESRAALSLIQILVHFDPQIVRLMAPQRFLPSNDLVKPILSSLEYRNDLFLQDLDVVYVAGFPPGGIGQKVSDEERSAFRLTVQHMKELGPNGTVLNPLPRIDEIDTGIDQMPQAFYFEQSRLGLFTRMAILEFVTPKFDLGTY